MQENHNLQSGCAEGMAKTAASAEKEVVRWLLLLASAKTCVGKNFLKILLPECSCQTERAAVRSPMRDVLGSVEAKCFLSTDELSYGELSAPIGGNGFRAGAGRMPQYRRLLKCPDVHREVKIFGAKAKQNFCLRSRP